MQRIASRTAALAGFVITAQVITATLARTDARLWQIAVPWLASLIAAALLANRRRPQSTLGHINLRSRELWFIAGLTILAGLLRLPNLERLPGIYGDEGEFGAIALDISQGRGPGPFGVAFLGDPALYVHILAPFVDWLGPTMVAIRLPSALIGIATVPLLYGLSRNLFGRYVAAIAGFLLATSTVHIHFSRLALNVIWVPFFTCLSLLLLKRGLDNRQSIWFLLAGISGGIGFYFHFGARLIVPLMLAILVTQAIFTDRHWRRWLEAMGALLGGALLALTPLLASLSNTPQLLNAHTNRRGIWNHWHELAERYGTTPGDKVGIFWEQIKLTILAFMSRPDSFHGAVIYRFMDRPLLPGFIAALAIGGVGLLLWRAPRRSGGTAARIILIWLAVPCLLASALTDVPGQAHRLLNPTVAGLVAAGFAVDTARRYLVLRIPAPAQRAAFVAMAVLIILAGAQESYRYTRPGATDEFGVAGTAQARCLEALPPGVLAIIDGAPRIYARHGPSRYLGHDIERRDFNQSLVRQWSGTRPTVILIHERNAATIESVRGLYPAATLIEVERPDGRRAITVIGLFDDESAGQSALAACRDNAET